MQNQQTANIIKQVCKSRNISISQLLIDCGLTKSFIYDLERRKTCPSADKFECITDYLDCSLDYLLGRTEIEAPSQYDEELLTDEKEILSIYRRFDERDKGEAIGYLKGMLRADKYLMEAGKNLA